MVLLICLSPIIQGLTLYYNTLRTPDIFFLLVPLLLFSTVPSPPVLTPTVCTLADITSAFTPTVSNRLERPRP